ncbi:MAG: GAF domain-containing protein [Spirochaetales bacterium]|nr:GAF domain-containing protein [Spirochaetales bacterium]
MNGITIDLENKLAVLGEEQCSLKDSIKELEKQESRFYNIFKNSAVAIWEEDFSEAYFILEKLPCNTREEYTKYLDEHSELLKELIDKIKILDINEAALKLLGVESKEQLLSSLDRLFIEESFSVLRDQFVTIAIGGYHYECETIGRRFDGVEFHILLTAFFPDKQGKSAFISMMDITDRVERDHHQSELLQETVEQKKIADILMDITFSLSSKTDQNDILDTILEQTEKVVPYSSANIMLRKNEKLLVARHKGYDKFGAANFMTKFAEDIAIIGASKTFKKFDQIQIIEDTKTSPHWIDFPETSYIKSFLSMPIEWQGDIIGLLNLDSDKKGSFSMEDVEKLKTICHAAAISLNRAKLFQQIEKEIEKRIKTEAILQFSLKEKELLLQEIHHRVKNNLTIILALINLQDTKLSNPAEIELFEELSQRIHSIALVHENLYENNDLSCIDFYSYTNDLIDSIRSVLIYRSDIKIKIDIPENIYFSLNKLIPIGLTLNELLTNSIKYAFPESGGEITITLDIERKNYILTVCDNGIGYPDNVLQGGNTHLGLILVNSLIDQIDGTVTLNNMDGASVTIRFSMPESYNE